MKLEEIILHVGMPKTGTTSIQRTLFYNRSLLARYGYLYPVCWNWNHNEQMAGLFSSTTFDAHFSILEGLQTSEQLSRWNDENIRLLHEEIDASNCNRIIFSAESLTTYLTVSDYKKITTFFEDSFHCSKIKLILYVRSPVAFCNSMLQQDISNGDSKEDALANLYKQLDGVFMERIPSLWESFGKENVIVIPFEKAAKSSEGLEKHFMKMAGIPLNAIGSMVEIVSENYARPMEVIDLFNYFNQIEPLILPLPDSAPGQLRQPNPKRSFGDTSPLFGVPGVKFSLPFEQLAQYFNFAHDDILWLKENLNIDYTNSLDSVSKDLPVAEYGPKTIEALLKAFPRLSATLKDLFLGYFERMYQRTGDKKFLPLFERGSAPDIECSFAMQFDRYISENSEQLSSLDVLQNHTKSQLSGDYLKIFLSEGEHFSESDAQSYNYTQIPQNFSIAMNFDEVENIKMIRVDPSIYPCAAILRQAYINGSPAQPVGGNFASSFHGIYAFLNCDPQLLFKSDVPIIDFKIEISVEPANYILSFCIHKGFIDTMHKWERWVAEEKELVASLSDALAKEKELSMRISNELSKEKQLTAQLFTNFSTQSGVKRITP